MVNESIFEFSSLYLQAYNDQCTSNWLDFLTTELNKEADVLEECRLTSEDVPVIGKFESFYSLSLLSGQMYPANLNLWDVFAGNLSQKWICFRGKEIDGSIPRRFIHIVRNN